MKLLRKFLCEESGNLKFYRDGSQFLAINRTDVISINIDGDTRVISSIPFDIVYDADYISKTKIVIAGISRESGSGIAIFDIETNRIIKHIMTGQILSICADEGKNRLFAGGYEEIHVYDYALNEQDSFSKEIIAPAITISHDGSKLAISGVFVEIWDVSNVPTLLSIECPLNSDCVGNPCEATSISITPDGKIAVAGFHGYRGKCVAIDVNTGKCMQWFPAKVPEQYYYQTRCVSVSRDGNYVATAEYESRIVTIFDIKTGEMMHEYDAKFWGSGGIAFSPTDDIIAIGAGSAIVLLKYDG